MLAAMALGFVGAAPCLWLMHHPDPALILAGQLALVVPAGMGLGIIPSVLTEAVAGRVRCTAVSLGYNIAFGVIGGLTPLTAAWLVARTDVDLSPAWLFAGAATISIATLLTFRETSPRRGAARREDHAPHPQRRWRSRRQRSPRTQPLRRGSTLMRTPSSAG